MPDGDGDDDWDEFYKMEVQKNMAEQLAPSFYPPDVDLSLEREKKAREREEFDEENLGEDFDDTPWFPPTISKAEDFKSHMMYHGGNAAISTETVCLSPGLGHGISMHFQFLYSMAICFALMSILSIPAIVFAKYGSRIPKDDYDPLGLYQFTIGNIGYDPSSATYQTDSACTSAALVGKNLTCIHVLGHEYSMNGAAEILTLCELFQGLIFLGTIFYLKRKLVHVEDAIGRVQTSVTEYAVMMSNLPPETTSEQIMSHFNSLYPLDKPDWKGRRPIQYVRPVPESTNVRNPIYVNTWIAECTIFVKIGKQLALFKAKESLINRLRRDRARVKMFREDSPTLLKFNPKRYAQAEKRMYSTMYEVEGLSKRAVVNSKPLSELQAGESDKLVGDIEHPENIHDFHAPLKPPTVLAFCIYEYAESARRCLEDYDRYSSFPMNLFYPQQLKFKGRRIVVRPAPEPDEIMWENVDKIKAIKIVKRFITFLIGVALLVLAFFIILTAANYKNEVSSQTPQLASCTSIIPKMYTNYSSPTVGEFADYTFTRPVVVDTGHLDRQCESRVGAGAFYSTLGYKGDYMFPIGRGTPAFSACNATLHKSICPNPFSKKYCPCLYLKSSEKCKQRSCFVSSSTYPSSCNNTVAASLFAECYCYETLLSKLKSGVIDTLQYIQGLGSGDTCSSFFERYLLTTGLTFGATFLIVIINTIIAAVIKVLNNFENYDYLDSAHASLIIKLFIVSYLNLAIVVVVAFGYIANVPPTAKQLGLLDGNYTDFTAGWYGIVGSYLLLTFVMSMASAPASSIFSYFIVNPLKRCYHYPAIRGFRSMSYMMQDDVNSLVVGPAFDTCKSMADTLTMIFFAMTYGSGIPLLIPLTCGFLIIFFNFDKYVVLRVCCRPPRMHGGIVRAILNWLPYALVLRLAVACWMFSNPNVFPATVAEYDADLITSTQYNSFVESNANQGDSLGVSWIAERIMRPTVFFLFAFLLLVILYKILHTFKLFAVIDLVGGAIGRLLHRLFLSIRKKKISPSPEAVANLNAPIHPSALFTLEDRREVAPFTGEYFNFVEEEKKGGWNRLMRFIWGSKLGNDNPEEWVLSQLDNHVIKTRVWAEDTNFNGNKYKKGYMKRTFEVISDIGCASFDLRRIPAYKTAMMGLIEATQHSAKQDWYLPSLIDKYAMKKDQRINPVTLWDSKLPPEKFSVDANPAPLPLRGLAEGEKFNGEPEEDDEDGDDDDEEEHDDGDIEDDNNDDEDKEEKKTMKKNLAELQTIKIEE